MRSPSFLLPVALAAWSRASPLEVAGGIPRSETGLVVHRSPGTGGGHMRKRENTVDLFMSLDNTVIFDGTDGLLADLLVTPPPPVVVTCVKCCTSGTITASINDDDFLDPSFRVDLRDASVFVELDISASGAATFTIPLLPSPAGFLNSLVQGVEADLGFSVDLVFDVQAGLDVRGGFALDFPDDIFFEASLFGGVMGDVSL